MPASNLVRLELCLLAAAVSRPHPGCGLQAGHCPRWLRAASRPGPERPRQAETGRLASAVTVMHSLAAAAGWILRRARSTGAGVGTCILWRSADRKALLMHSACLQAKLPGTMQSVSQQEVHQELHTLAGLHASIRRGQPRVEGSELGARSMGAGCVLDAGLAPSGHAAVVECGIEHTTA